MAQTLKPNIAKITLTIPYYFDIDLTFDLHDTATIVTAVSQVKQLKEDTTLQLEGESLKLVSVSVNGEVWTRFEEKEGALEISALPETFELKIVTEINPEENTALEGLYKSGGAFCTQCEAEGFVESLTTWIARMC